MSGKETVSLVENQLVPTLVKSNANGVTIEMQPDKKERGKALRQIIAAFVANLGTINTGLIFGFSAVVIPQLMAEDSIIKIDETQASWIASLSSASTPIGCILTGYLMDNIGRRKSLLLTEIPLFIGWILIACATNVEMIYAGRLFVGLGSGMVGAPARVYTSEVTQPHLRGMLSALASVSISFGVLFQYTIGSITTWQILSAISAVLPVIAFVSMWMMPETPNFLVASNKPTKAAKSLAKLRGSTYNLQREVDQLQHFANKNNAKKLTSPKEIMAALLSPETLKPFGILVLYFMMYQFSGVNTITFYAVEIFQDSGSTLDKYTCTIMLGAVRLICTIFGCIAMRRCGRRPLTFISGIGCGVSMLGLGTYMYYSRMWSLADPPTEPSVTWFPVACIFVFTITCSLGFLVVPWTMIGELYPMKVRGIVGGFTTMAAHSFVFIVVKTYPFLSHVLFKHGTFMLYGCISLLGTIFLFLVLPETKGKTLQEIEDYFSGRTKTIGTKKNTNGATYDNNLNNTKPPVLTIEKDKLLP